MEILLVVILKKKKKIPINEIQKKLDNINIEKNERGKEATIRNLYAFGYSHVSILNHETKNFASSREECAITERKENTESDTRGMKIFNGTYTNTERKQEIW